MAAMAQTPTTLARNLASRNAASDLLSSSSSGVPLKALGSAQFGMRDRRLTITAKARKIKKHEYPWPEDPDPNVKGGVLTHLSYFKPLKEKLKPVTLEFEKPLLDLQKQIIDVQKIANETGLDFSDKIISLENKYQQALKDLYTHLTPIQRLQIARHPNRPTFLDHVFNITDKFVELHGDRAGYDDPSIVTGIGTINEKRYMFIGHQKGRNTKENIQRNFGMPTPHGYRKALRMMLYAHHHGFPIVTFIDTPGAYADIKSEELGQGEAIARNLWTMFGLDVPIVAIVIGEGGSGGALAIGCANKMLMLENSVFYVASPEACAAILWKSAKAAPKAAEKLKITAPELIKLQIADGIIPEPLGGAHADPYWTSQQIKEAIVKSMDEFSGMDAEAIKSHRQHKYRKIAGYQEGVQIEPEKKINMKKREVGLRDEIEKLKQQVLESVTSDAAFPESGIKKMIERIKESLDKDYDEAAKALGMEEKILMVQEEIAKGGDVSDHLSQLTVKEKIEQLQDQFNKSLPYAPNYPRLKYKLDTMNELSKALSHRKASSETDALKSDINKRFTEIVDRPDVKQKFETLMADVESAGGLDGALSPELEERILQFNRELDSAFKNVLQSEGIQLARLDMTAKAKLDSFNAKISMVVADSVASSPDVKAKVDLLKAEAAKSDNDENTKAKIQALEAETKEALKEAINFPDLKEMHEKLMAEIKEAATDDESTTVDGPQEFSTSSLESGFN